MTTTTFRYDDHPRLAERRQEGPPTVRKSARKMTGSPITRFNSKVGLAITRSVGGRPTSIRRGPESRSHDTGTLLRASASIAAWTSEKTAKRPSIRNRLTPVDSSRTRRLP